MYKAFNKIGNIEVEGNSLKYRIATQDINIEDEKEIEKDIKRTLQALENQDVFLLPFDIQTVNRYMVLYYDLSHYSGIEYLREIPLHQKLNYFISLIQIAKAEREGIRVLWDKMNFVIDKYEEKVKVLLFETEHLKIYEEYNSLKSVVDIMTSSMTTLTKVFGLPKRNDFIDPSSENIQFVETIFRLDNLDDLQMYIETLMIDIESQENLIKESEKKKRIFSLEGKPKTKKAKPKYSGNKNVTKSKVSKNSTKTKWLVGGVIGIVLVSWLLPIIFPPGGNTSEAIQEDIPIDVINEKDSSFKGSQKHNNELVIAYQKAYNSEYEDAYKILASIPKKELSSLDAPMLIKVYDKANKLGSLLDEMPVLANDVITYLLTIEQIDRLPEIAGSMQTNNPYIQFEVAYLVKDYERMLSFINNIEINGRKEQQIFGAYLELGKLDEARDFANSVGNPDLIKQLESYKN